MAISEEELTERAEALPFVAASDPALRALHETDRLRLDQLLESLGSPLPQLIRNAIDGLADEVTEELPHTTDGHILISPDQIEGIITRAALAGGTAVESAVGDSLVAARQLEAAFSNPA